VQGDGSFQEKQWDTGDEGGSTSVVLANRNDVEAVNDHTKVRLLFLRLFSFILMLILMLM
jgi:hypothetical protein